MSTLILAMILFVGGHFLLSARPLRTRIVGAIGERAFAGVYSLLMIVLLVWAVMAYADAETSALWAFGDWARWLAVIAMLPAFILLAAAYMTPNPTAVMGQRLYKKDDPAPGIFRITRHPLMWGISLWALMHLLNNGDSASAVFFGGLLVLSALGPVHIDAKRRAQDAEGYGRLTARAPFWPWGKGWVSPLTIGWSKLAVGAVLWVVFLGLHPWLFGVAPITHG